MDATELIKDQDTIRYWSLSVMLKSYQEHMRYVSYAHAERDAGILASKLRSQYSQEELKEFAFVGIPRGGLIVLGMLAYQLNLPKQQLVDAPKPMQPICLVDDCGLTGKRTREWIMRLNAPRVVVAYLYASQRLRQSIVEAEASVECCISSHDLLPNSVATDFDQQLDADNERYTTSPLEQVCFAWSEPATLLTDPLNGEIDERWHCMPPHKVLSHRVALGLPIRTPDRLVWVVPDSVVWSWENEELWLLQTDTQQVQNCIGEQADVWRALASYGQVALAKDVLNELYNGRGEALVDEHLVRFEQNQFLMRVEN